MKTEVIILGSGPSGLQASIYLARRKKDVLVCGKIKDSSLYNVEVENYFGVKKIAGADLLKISRNQALDFGVKFCEQDIVSVEKMSDNQFQLMTEDGDKIIAKKIIIATGVKRKTLGLKNEKEFLGKGLSYCVECDGFFFRGKNVAITGDGSAACNGALTLTEYAENVFFVFKNLDVTDALKNKIYANKKIQIIEQTHVVDIKGENEFLQKIMLSNGKELEVDGFFIELGAKGALELFCNIGLEFTSDCKHIKTDANQKTNITGIFCVGDICGAPYQIARAVGQGAMAGIKALEE